MLEANKTSNKDTIKMMRSENKQLQMALAQIAQSATKVVLKSITTHRRQRVYHLSGVEKGI